MKTIGMIFLPCHRRLIFSTATPSFGFRVGSPMGSRRKCWRSHVPVYTKVLESTLDETRG